MGHDCNMRFERWGLASVVVDHYRTLCVLVGKDRYMYSIGLPISVELLESRQSIHVVTHLLEIRKIELKTC